MDETRARSAFENALRTYHQDFNTFFLARLFGMKVEYGEESCTVMMPISDFMFNPQGSLHGGVTATVLDISMGHLLKHHVGAGATLEMNIQYIRAAREGMLTANSHFIRKGRQICFLRSEATDDTGGIVASATSTWKVL
ncbi:PaaI family thioesterase [Burkholderia sp. Bp9142]|uniref:PaaI family thioesterase n=1 Tax=Burkholderia sp. Bp9142 TaxID=2184573 RepID=UPI000F5935EE|nr:PaaI family thioesterase [Burkholderia sp. Bp9142]RQR26490.1 PaaI family thioesterase [Burkholderia sp. Bp9142]